MKTRLLALAFVLFAAPAFAQTTATLNPTVAVFQASPDHSVTVGGSAVVTSYTLEVYDGTTLARSSDLGKPTPAANGDISVPLAQGTLAKNKVYTFQIVTVGPGGSVRAAAPSNPFAWLGAPSPASNLRAQ